MEAVQMFDRSRLQQLLDIFGFSHLFHPLAVNDDVGRGLLEVLLDSRPLYFAKNFCP